MGQGSGDEGYEGYEGVGNREMKKYLIFIIAALILLTACKQTERAPETMGDLPPVTSATENTPPADTPPANMPPANTLPANTPPVAGGFRFTIENMPIIDGSTATIPLIGAVYSVLLGIPRSQADTMVSISGTDHAYLQLINSKADILLVYSPSPYSHFIAETEGVEFEMAAIGRDGLVFLVNILNPVMSLRPEQIVSIYSGETANWKEVGGVDIDIIAFQRPYLSGSQTMMDELVMKDVPMAETEVEYIIGEMGGLVYAVASFDNAESAIGYNVYYFVSKMEMNEKVRMLAVGGVDPSTESISDGSYPFVSDFYAVIRKDAPEDSPERILFNWIQSEDGQNLVRHEGYAIANDD